VVLNHIVEFGRVPRVMYSLRNQRGAINDVDITVSQADSSGNGFESRGLDLEVTRVKRCCCLDADEDSLFYKRIRCNLLTLLNFNLYIANKFCS